MSGAGLRCATPMLISRVRRGMAGTFPGPSGTKTSAVLRQVDQFIGVCGGTDDQDSLPGSKYMLPPPRRAVANGCCRRPAQKSASRSLRDGAPF